MDTQASQHRRRIEQTLQVVQSALQAFFHSVKWGACSRRSRKHTMAVPQSPRVFEANRPLLREPNEIYPGQTPRIPQ
jgi:hypothetical protein